MAFAIALAILLTSAPATSQGVLGCSIVPASWGAVQQGLDKLFLGACTRHDLCYRTCNPVNGPYVGLGYKTQCDSVFGVDMALACETWTLLLTFPNSEWIEPNDFLDECLDYASYAVALVGTVGYFPFFEGQCSQYCNQSACSYVGLTYTQFFHDACLLNCWGGRDPNDCEQSPWGYDCPPCPIGLDLQGNGFKLTGPNPPVYFDLDGDGTPNHTSWTRVHTKDGFLVLDRNRDGRITDGRELFGNSTPLILSPALARHGYEALEEFDRSALGGNENGMIDQQDRIFEHLQIWLDKNRDGSTQEGELRHLAEVGVREISLAYYREDVEDQWGNSFRWWSPIYFDDGSVTMSVDIFFQRLPE